MEADEIEREREEETRRKRRVGGMKAEKEWSLKESEERIEKNGWLRLKRNRGNCSVPGFF